MEETGCPAGHDIRVHLKLNPTEFENLQHNHEVRKNIDSMQKRNCSCTWDLYIIDGEEVAVYIE